MIMGLSVVDGTLFDWLKVHHKENRHFGRRFDPQKQHTHMDFSDAPSSAGVSMAHGCSQPMPDSTTPRLYNRWAEATNPISRI